MRSFEVVFGRTAQATASAPGRVNLMGEHTDYNQGFVLPTPLPLFTTVQLAVDESDPNFLEVFSVNLEARSHRHLNEQAQGHWSDYVLACVQQLQKQVEIPGLKVWVESTVPIGAGVSSSAALEVAVLKGMRSLLNLNLSDQEIALMAQRAENEGVGMPCGVMDQMVAAMGVPHQALFLDTRDLSFELILLPSDYQFAVVHSGITHALAAGSYRQRRQECEAAAAGMGVASLREVELNQLETSDLPEVLRRRSRHVVTENRRVLNCVAALKENRVRDLGLLMNESHLSQKNDFEVTVAETDALCEAALNHGALGARQTGGGFGGAIVALVEVDRIELWWENLSQFLPQFAELFPNKRPILFSELRLMLNGLEVVLAQ
jgi:galactokinase